MSSAAWRVLPPSPPPSSRRLLPPRHPLHDHSTLSKKTAASRRRRAVPCRATGGRGDYGLLWLPRRDVLTGLSGVAAGLVGYPDLASAAALEKNPVDNCSKAEKVMDTLIDCKVPDRNFPCPPSASQIVDFVAVPENRVMRVRKPAHLLDAEYQEKYKEAVRKMRELPADNPLSFAAQAAIHESYCDGHYRYDPTEKNRAFDVHFSWIFAPWHRMYLYFYERALGQLIGDDTFALPYWNWDAPEGMAIPAMFKGDPLGIPGPLYDPNRNLSHLDALVDLDYLATPKGTKPIPFNRTSDEEYKKAVRRNLCTIYQQQIRAAKGPRAFLGEKLCSEANFKINEINERSKRREKIPASRPQSQGTLERMAHTSVHVWVGRPGPGCECPPGAGVLGNDGKPHCNYDMGFLGTAARDPLFYSHHANIDRLWHIWSTEPESKNSDDPPESKNFDDPEWLDNSFVFYDDYEKQQLVRMKFRDVLKVQKLGYTYEEESAKPSPWRDIKLTRLSPGKGSSSSKEAPPKYPLVLTKDKVVVVPAVVVPAVSVPAKEGKEEAKEGKEELVLVIEGIEYDPAFESKFDVAINVPKEDALEVGPEFIEYAGSFSVVASSKKDDDKKKYNNETLLGKTTLFIDNVLKDLGAIGPVNSTVDVVLVPRSEGKITLYLPPTIQKA